MFVHRYITQFPVMFAWKVFGQAGAPYRFRKKHSLVFVLFFPVCYPLLLLGLLCKAFCDEIAFFFADLHSMILGHTPVVSCPLEEAAQKVQEVRLTSTSHCQ